MPGISPKPLLLRCGSICLVPLQQNHLQPLAEIAFESGLWKFTTKNISTQQELMVYINEALLARESGSAYPFFIFDEASGAPVGCSRYGNISLADSRLEIGWTWYAAHLHGTGVNKKVKYAMLAFAFDVLGLNRVEFKADARNARSRAALGKIGAVQEGVLRSHMRVQGGWLRDTVYFSILKDEWQNLSHTVFKGYTFSWE